ncbi:class I SAM-dependent methyltransferase [Lentzea terrae]|uniref:class I SAM-dependent methyltransferase n=1 Tax=Lentzea terrae TaxID=2200761 RepID=UPI000DD36B5A|nr:class I SAM-dependent methyltransferase [Lentzea terrae]
MAESDEQYDALGAIYERAKHIPTGLAERATLLSAVGDLRGKSVLDVACGTGFYARLFHDLGATKVAGVDSAGEMIEYARHVERREWRGITYQQHDATTLPVLGEFDVVTAVWLLGYADDVPALDAMISNLEANLAENGRLVVLVPNPEPDWELYAQYGRYGYEIIPTGPMNLKQPVRVRVLGDPPFDFDSFYWERGVFEDALVRAGLTDVTRQPVVVPDEEESWDGLLQCPSFGVFTAVRDSA